MREKEREEGKVKLDSDLIFTVKGGLQFRKSVHELGATISVSEATQQSALFITRDGPTRPVSRITRQPVLNIHDQLVKREASAHVRAEYSGRK